MITIELSTGKEIQLTVDEYRELAGILGGQSRVERKDSYPMPYFPMDPTPCKFPWDTSVRYEMDRNHATSGDGVNVWG